jgi:outer membrane murein-binding lipoprotein Lpp
MNRSRAAALLASALLLAACSSEPTYDQAAEQCSAAVKALPAGAQRNDPRPKACERLTEQDYNLIFASKVLQDKGLMTPSP